MPVRTDRPRIWHTPTTLATLKSLAAANDPRWVRLKAIVDRNMVPTWDVNIMDYALCYLVTGNPAYAQCAITLMMSSVADGLKAITGDSGYQTRTLLPAAAITYDWLNDQLTADQKTQLRAAMELWADWVWPETNPSRKGAWGVDDCGNNYYYGFLFTWMIGLALAGDSPKAQGYIDAATNRWQTVVKPYLATMGAGGVWAEGTNYGVGSSFRICWMLNAHRTATGQDLFQEAGFTWMKELALSTLYLTSPTLDRKWCGGDQARESGAGLFDYDRSVGLSLAARLDATTASWLKWWLDNINPNPGEMQLTAWEEFLNYPTSLTAIDYRQTLPLSFLAPGIGLGTWRTDWSTGAVQVYLSCGLVTQSHQELAAGMFCVFKSDWMVGLGRLTSHSGLLPQTIYNNAPIFGGRGQYTTAHDLDIYAHDVSLRAPQILKFVPGSTFNYMACDTTPAYNYWDNKVLNPVTNHTRHLIHVKPNFVLLLDQFAASDKAFDKRFPLNLNAEPAVLNHTFGVTVGKNVLYGSVQSGSNVILEKIANSDSTGGDCLGWRVDTIVPSGTTASEYVLTVLEIAPITQTVITPVQASFDPATSLLKFSAPNISVSLSVASGSAAPAPSGGAPTNPPGSGSGIPVNPSGSGSGVPVIPPTSGSGNTVAQQLAALQQTFDMLQATCNLLAANYNTVVAARNTLSGQVTSLTAANTQLLAVVANLNQQIASLTQQLADLKVQLGSLQTDSDSLRAQLAIALGKIASAKTALN